MGVTDPSPCYERSYQTLGLADIVRMIKPRFIRCVKHLERMGELRNTYRIFV
jgi:hypothetical protein